MTNPTPDAAPDFTWRVTNTDGDISLQFGTELSAAPASDTAKVKALGQALVKIGMQLVQSHAPDDYDED